MARSHVRFASRCMLVGGVAEVLVGVMHFFMPAGFGALSGFDRLPEQGWSFVVLATVAIGFFLLVFGIWSIAMSRRLLAGDNVAWLFGLSQGVLWMARVGLELAHPVQVPLFTIPNPTTVVLPLCAAIGLLFLLPLLWLRRSDQWRALHGTEASAGGRS